MEPQELMDLAKKAMKHAHAPYSNFKVGAAVLTKSGKVFKGCNVENSAFGLTMCAERVAMYNAVSEGEEMEALAVVAIRGDSNPCGSCRQVMNEFNRDAIIYFYKDGEMVKATAGQLLPDTFHLQTIFKVEE